MRSAEGRPGVPRDPTVHSCTLSSLHPQVGLSTASAGMRGVRPYPRGLCLATVIVLTPQPHILTPRRAARTEMSRLDLGPPPRGRA